ncbi:MAG TPA: hypothetical protein VJ720_11440 [Chitinophaga sp.]|uniref:Uncharacterized protein n=1 Tax=Chitinophaga tropicalis TaxID=2683588 RepID=A0A7K1U690_9BACT|nr:hypothetical protein [Chitinophaga tropicalis]MVT09878.1 hypothetical protein [Chitinophaga tropicalis]HJT74630.1 hypothetical protein [Chitinophaga sp.]
MPLNKSGLEQSIKSAFKSMKDAGGDEEQGLNQLCSKLAEAVDTYVKTATINYTTGLTTAAGGGPVTGVFNGNLS